MDRHGVIQGLFGSPRALVGMIHVGALPGTPGAHIMIPINPKPTKSSITDVAADPVTQATLVLPNDLRAGATVYTYDANGDRKVLRKGTNQIECTPKGDDGFTWCYNVAGAARRCCNPGET